MADKDLLKQLSHLGLPLFQTEDYFDVNELLANVVKSNDNRLWESFPLLLANANEKEDFSSEEVEKCSMSATNLNSFRLLFLLSMSFYRCLGVRFSWADRFYENLNPSAKTMVAKFENELKTQKGVVLESQRLNTERMQKVFTNYFNKRSSEVRDLKDKRENLSLEQAMSRVFTDKQKELFLKRFKGEKMTKTEKEYFSRTVKKKVLALANSELHGLAKEMLSKF